MRTLRRRRLEKKTDYKARLALLKSGEARLVVRKTNRYIIAQFIHSNIAQDKIIVGITSKDLLSKGWPKEYAGSLKSLPASYLTGYLLGKLAQKHHIKEAVFDIGMHRSFPKSRFYSLLKGAIDAGLNIPFKQEVLPTEEDLKKIEKLKSLIDKIKHNIK